MTSRSTAFHAMLALSCAAFIYLENKGSYFGKLTNSVDPCLQNPLNSAPCYAATSTDAMLTAVIVGLSALVVLLFQLSVASKA